jgi:tRNA A58 N-methylase Trm61
MRLLVVYAALVHHLRRFLSERGSLASLDSAAEHSRTALWLRSLLSVLDFDDFQKLDIPWWTFHAGDQVAQFLSDKADATVFEWGSGASTVWLSRRAARVVSVESDPVWAAKVAAKNLPNVQLLPVVAPPLDATSTGQSQRMGFRDRDFSAYVDTINHMDQTFDVIVIDGRARGACLSEALPRLRLDGILVFDNTNRRRYKKALRGVKDKVSVTTTMGLTPILLWPSQTSIVTWAAPEQSPGSLEPC